MSKAFWGSRGKKTLQRTRLRDFFGVTDCLLPLKYMNMRNNFEHLDERIDDWHRDSKTRRFIDMNFGDVAKVFPGVDEIDFFRNYDPVTLDIRFAGLTVNFNAIAAEVERVRRVVEP